MDQFIFVQKSCRNSKIIVQASWEKKLINIEKLMPEYRPDIIKKAFELDLDFEKTEYNEINRIPAKEYNDLYERWLR